MKNIITIIYACLFSFSLAGQGLSDALRFSIVNPGGTARTIGAGGAFGALGGDFGSIGINPAGLGTYRSSEFVLSPSLTNQNVFSIMQGANSGITEDKSYLGLNNLGMVLNNNPTGSDWYTSNLAIGFNKIASFNKRFSSEASTIGSITERFKELADGNAPASLDDFEAYPAYLVGAIYDFDEDNIYDTDFSSNPDQLIPKAQRIEQRGSINEITISWGGNYKNKVNIGFGLGLPFISFEEDQEYAEGDTNDEIDGFEDLNFTEYIKTTGTGVNFKAGFIYIPMKEFRVGLSLQSPTWYFITDDYGTSISYAFTDPSGFQSYSEISDPGTFQYRFKAPWKITASAGTLYKVGKLQGFLSADLEFRDYSTGSFNLSAYSSDPSDREYGRELNNDIEDEFAASTSLRLGTELAYQKLRARAGIQIEQSAFAIDEKATDNTLSLGLGFRENRFFLDFAMIYSERSEGYIPYTVSDNNRLQLAINDVNTSHYVLTVGYKL